MSRCRHGCGQDVVWEDQHLIATPDGDAWMCAEPPLGRLLGNEPKIPGVDFDPLTEMGRILGLPTKPPWTWGLVFEVTRALMATSHPMYLTCPKCNARHIDEGEFATKPHHTHSCQSCGLTWRPMVGNTVGVQFLPGFKNT